MDETTLTSTLHDLAAGAPLHSSPSTDARRRAARLRRRRRTGAAGLCLVLAFGLGWTALHLPGPSRHAAVGGTINEPENWRVGLGERGNPNYSTSDEVVVPGANAPHEALYWQNDKLCLIDIHPDQSSAGSSCFSAPGRNLGLISLYPQPTSFAGPVLPEQTLFTTAADVSRVRITRSDGTVEDVPTITATGFRARAGVVDGSVVSLRAINSAGDAFGDAIAGPDAVAIRQVERTTDCGKGAIPTGEVQGRDSDTCFVLAPGGLTVAPTTAVAQDPAGLGWEVQVSLAGSDVAAFDRLTEVATTARPPTNRLAFVLHDSVVSDPTIQAPLGHGTFAITYGIGAGLTKRTAEQLAAELMGRPQASAAEVVAPATVAATPIAATASRVAPASPAETARR